jgi:propionate CoA-transferase
MKAELMAAEDAVALVPDNATLCLGGGGAGHAVPDRLFRALGARFAERGRPRGLTLIHPCGIGNAADRGLSHLAHEGLVRRVVGGFWGNSPAMVALARREGIEGYNFPQGVLSHLMRACAAGAPGLLTKTGLHTFVDPRLEGGKVNASAREDLVELVEFRGEEYLFYRAPRIDFAFIRGTSVDRESNLSMEEEVATFAMLSIAQAARRNGGKVIAQAKRRFDGHTAPVHVKVPGVLIDGVVLDPEQEMTFLSPWEPALISRTAPYEAEGWTFDGIARVIARRAALELFDGAFVNLGFGMPDGVPIVARAEGVLDRVVFLIEQGAVGGIPTTGLNFGAMFNPQAILDDGYQFDFFHGGNLDLAFLGFAQIDRRGNVNSSRFGSQLTGCGGFVDISQHARKVVFCGAFAAKSNCVVEGGRLRIVDGGRIRKFLKSVEQVTFSGPYAQAKGQSVLVVTERCVFEGTPAGLRLAEVAPGVDLRRDVLEMMDFEPIIPSEPRLMDARLFGNGSLELRHRMGLRGRSDGIRAL